MMKNETNTHPFSQTGHLAVATVPVTSISNIAPVLSKEFLDIQAITECRFTLNVYVTL